MENDTYHFIGLPYGRQSAVRMTAGVVGNPNLVAGLLLGYFFIGFASYFWAFWSQYSRLTAFKEAITTCCSVEQRSIRSIQKIYKVIPRLIFIDTVNAITAIILAIEFIGSCQSAITCAYVFIVWYMLRWFGSILHLLSALECLMVLCNPQLGVRSRIINACVVSLMIVCSTLYIYIDRVAVIVLGAITIGLALAIIAMSPKSTVSPSAATGKKLIVLLAMLTFGIVFAPTFIAECLVMNAVNQQLLNNYIIFHINALFCTNLQILMNGLLCYVILKLPSEEEEQQQQQNMENANYAP